MTTFGRSLMDHQEPRHEVHQCVIVHTESSIGPLKAAVVNLSISTLGI